jgi:hypothetical protein
MISGKEKYCAWFFLYASFPFFLSFISPPARLAENRKNFLENPKIEYLTVKWLSGDMLHRPPAQDH